MNVDAVEKPFDLPHFELNLERYESELDEYLKQNREKIEQLLQQPEPYNWNNLIQPLEDLHDQLEHFWAPINHLHAVRSSDELRQVYHRCLPKLTDYRTELSHNLKLFHAIQSIADGLEYQQLNSAQKKVIDNDIRDFTLAGALLPDDKKKRFSELSKELSHLMTKFEENVLDATHAWSKHILDEEALSGIPLRAIEAARLAAKNQNLKGWVFTLDIPSYLAVMSFADSRSLREEMYYAFNTRASEIGPNAGQFDNGSVMQRIMSLRWEMALLLGYENYAEYALQTRMVETSQQAFDFLYELVKKATPKAKDEFADLCQFARDRFGVASLEAWDIPYFSEKLRQAHYNISPEDLRPFFPEPQVTKGLFTIVNKLFGVRMEHLPHVLVWHPDVKCYALYDAENHLRAYCYFDLYARANKRGGAWMDNYQTRRRLKEGNVQLPIALVTCNFPSPLDETPSLWNHEEVLTLFHEFGHALQHMLTVIDYAPLSGINGIPWDAVELASQFLENWTWQKESLELVAKHYKTESDLPDDLYERMWKARHFHTGLQMLRQLEFALFDMQLHVEFNPQEQNQIQKVLNDIRKSVSVIPVPHYNRFQNSFSHIFAGGYAAGYYSYKWAEVMAADAFSLFEEKGLFDPITAKHFMNYILEPGGSEDPLELFKAFRGRAPQVDALLKQDGIR